MKTILHPDYWVEVPAGEYLRGFSEQQRVKIAARIRQQIGWEQATPAFRERMDGLVAKVQHWAAIRQEHRNWGPYYFFTQEDIAFIREQPFVVLLDVERALITLPPSVQHVERFYIARFPLTIHQMVLFRQGVPARDLPGALEEPEFMDAMGHPIDAEQYDALEGYRRLGRAISAVRQNDAGPLLAQLEARLPTRFEWEKAARGTDGRLYPWGDEWNPNAGFFWYGQAVRYPDKVDAFPEGVSPYGVWYMAGGLPEGYGELKAGYRYGTHLRETTEEMAWFGHMVVTPGNAGSWVYGMRPVLDRWPTTQWSGFRAEIPGVGQ